MRAASASPSRHALEVSSKRCSPTARGVGAFARAVEVVAHQPGDGVVHKRKVIDHEEAYGALPTVPRDLDAFQRIAVRPTQAHPASHRREHRHSLRTAPGDVSGGEIDIAQ